jgi:hypothetical protein
MEYVVVAFRSRTNTVKVSKYLSENGVYNEIINTPKEAGVGCGLSIKIEKERFAQVKRIVLGLSLSSFAGFFLVKNVAGMRVVKSI